VDTAVYSATGCFPGSQQGLNGHGTGFILTTVTTLASPLPSPLNVIPGEEAVCEVTIRNGGTLVDKYTCEILGAAAVWTQVTPPMLNLLPGTEGQVELHLHPPRQPTPPAGPMPFGLRVISTEQGAEPALQNSNLEIAPFADTKAQLRPRSAPARRSAEHRLTVANQGNVAVDVAASATDPDELLAFDVPGVGSLQPGGTAEGELRCRPRKLMLVGRAQPRPFQVVVATRPTSPGPAAIPVEDVVLDGTMVQKPLFPWWLLTILALIVILATIEPELALVPVALALVGFIVQRVRKPQPPGPTPPGPAPPGPTP
jgi:hypothetical protein